MEKPYKYHYRPGYGRKELLLEFYQGVEKDFYTHLFEAIAEIEPKVDSIKDLWMNDEVLLNVNSNVGDFILSKDIWDFAFIMSETNQKCLEKINELLLKSSLFEKVEVNFDAYQNIKKEF
jgi:hypothetical protein